MFLEVLFTIVVVAALALLVFVFIRGMGRRARFRSFVSNHGGQFSADDDHDLTGRIRSLLDDDVWIGYSARLENEDGTRFVFDLHDRVAGSPRKTGAMTELREPVVSRQIVLREAMPDSTRSKADRLHERYELVGAAWDDVPDVLRHTLEARPPASSHPSHDWLLEIRVDGTDVFVAARDRPLSSRDEWEALLDLLERLRGRE